MNHIINHNYHDIELYKAIVGESGFAESFISSEWYFRAHDDFSFLEQTAVIAGYLKSIEQLLFAIICLSMNTGKRNKRSDRNCDCLQVRIVSECPVVE